MKRIGISLSVASSLFLSPLPAWAEEEVKKGLPQLDAALYPDLLFWLAICFPLLYILMHNWIVPAFQDTQGNRRQILDTDLYAAKAASATAEDVRQGYENALAAARAEAEETVEGILAEAKQEAEERNARLQKDLNRRIEEAEQRIRAKKTETMNDAPRVVKELATSIVDRVLSGSGIAQKA